MAKKPSPVDRLMQYMDACARQRGEMMFTQGYRARLNATSPQDPDLVRLYQKEQNQNEYCGVVEARFRTAAQRLLREARKGVRVSRRLPHGDPK